MAEPEGRAGPGGEPEGGALPEGAERSAADSARRASMQALSGQSAAASCLDLAAALDEPETLIRELKRIAEERDSSDKRWIGVRRLCERAEEYFEVMNRPEANRPHGSKLGGD
jgi:hypothetical protein